MPRKDIEHSRTIIYKLVCNDLTITDIYIGCTTDFTKRKAKHKSCCNNPNAKQYNFYVYQFIRDNGTWSNWNMILVEEFPCGSKLEASKRERYWIEELKATLNKNVPSRTGTEYYQDNKDKKLEYQEQYYQNNRDTRLEYQEQYNLVNRDKILEQKKEKYECHCGGKFIHTHRARHLASKLHKSYELKLSIPEADPSKVIS